jgi:Raf kinase inhibitor-like YbhB/YbcL family protein
MRISSKAFAPGATIPERYTLDGPNLSPPLHIEDVPAQARSLALVVEDPDAPGGTFNHWLLFNMDPKIKEIRENSAPVWATRGRNDFGDLDYDGPKPPAGTHHYHFRLFALDAMLGLQPGAQRSELEQAMAGHVLAQADLTGIYAHN